jgi:hypothetical protein
MSQVELERSHRIYYLPMKWKNKTSNKFSHSSTTPKCVLIHYGFHSIFDEFKHF